MTIARRIPADAGVAIGAILFVVAILAILIGAIAAGTGGLGGGSASESHRTMGGTIVQQSTMMTVGFQRLITGGVDPADIIITEQYTTPNELRALYSPRGGGLVPVQPPRDAIAAGATWRYVVDANMRDFGASGDNDVVAMLQIRNDVICRAINSVVIGYNAPLSITLAVLPGVPTTLDVTGVDGVMDSGNSLDTSAVASLSGVRQACVQDGGGSPNYWYYQVIRAN